VVCVLFSLSSSCAWWCQTAIVNTHHNSCWTPPYTRRRKTKQKAHHNSCLTPPCTGRRQRK
jgi:hypothetical protein